MRRRRGIMGLNGGAGIPVIAATATGNPLTFETDMVKPLKSLVIPFTPIQEGSGDPSPTNVRPIDTWTGCEITHTGKNLFDKNSQSLWTPKKYLAEDGTEVSNNGWMITNYIPVKGTAFTLSSIGENSPSICLYDVNKQYITGKKYGTSSAQDLTDVTVSTTDEVAYIRFSVNTLADLTAIQLEIGDAATTYEEYRTPSTIQVTFTDPTTGDPLTVYGGTLTLNEDRSADLVSDFRAMNLKDVWDDNRWTRVTSGTASPYFEHDFSSCDVSRRMEIVCNMYKTIIPNAANPHDDACGLTVTGMFRIFDDRYSTVANFKNHLVDIYLAHPLTSDSPRYHTYHFDNIGQLVTFLNTNAIWTDTNGTNTATYLKHQS